MKEINEISKDLMHQDYTINVLVIGTDNPRKFNPFIFVGIARA